MSELKDLEAGDYCYALRRNGRWTLEQIAKVTPTGQIRLESGERFTPEGYKIGGDSWDNAHLYPPTEEHRVRYITQEQRRHLRDALDVLVDRCNTLDFQTAKTLCETLDQFATFHKRELGL